MQKRAIPSPAQQIRIPPISKSPSNPSHMPISDSETKPVLMNKSMMNSTELAITQLFDLKATESWFNFSNACAKNLEANIAQIEKLNFLFEKPGIGVEKRTWICFLQWFTPLTSSDIYQTEESNEKNGGWDIDAIVSVCSPQWFHGFMDSKDAQRLLKGKPEGTFLVRFSTQPCFYTLSVSYSGTVGHWRIGCEKKEYQLPCFKIENRSYLSLDDVINTHKKEALKIKLPKPGQKDHCFLTNPHVRAESVESYYQTG